MDNGKQMGIDVMNLIKKATQSGEKGELGSQEGINKFLNDNLSRENADAVTELLKDENKTKALLNSDEAKKLFKLLMGENKNG